MSSEAADGVDGRWQRFCEELSAEAKFGVELGLESMHRALAGEDHPERSSTAILVAGTNGKGGTAAYIAGLLQAHGLRVGLYTSPHLIDLAERFRVDGRALNHEQILRVGRPILEAYGGDGEPDLTYFELTTLMAARCFEAAAVDVAVYEIGLGGKLDAVNAIDPAVSVITCIDTDHTDYLGETLPEIAREKCGIARPGRPLVVGRQTHAELLDLFPDCAPDATLELYGRDFDDSDVERLGTEGGPERRATWPWTKRANAATALRAARHVLGDGYVDERAGEGLGRTCWPGRFDERVVDASRWGGDGEVRVLFDAAHNPGAVDALFDQLEDWPDAFSAVVCGGMADKELERMFARLDKGPAVWGATLPTDRTADPERLRTAIPNDRLVEILDTPSALGAGVRRAVEQGGRLLVFGSVYLVGACFEALEFGAEDLEVFAGKRQEAV